MPASETFKENALPALRSAGQPRLLGEHPCCRGLLVFVKALYSLLRLSRLPFDWYQGAGARRRSAHFDTLAVHQTTVVVARKFLRVAKMKDEDHQEEIRDPGLVLEGIRESVLKADIFTFDQKIPNTVPRYDYYHEFDSLAVIHIESYEDWWNHKIQNDARRMVRKAQKQGLQVRPVPFSDELMQGIKEIWDESPLRRGKPFNHYQKDFETVKAVNNTYPERTEFIAAYLDEEMVGFAKMFYTANRADLIQIISKMKHRDKAPTNALLAKAVEVCAEKKIPHLGYAKLVYGRKGPDSLTEWKLRNGCEQVLVPRYYIPLTLKGRLALSCNLHKGLMQALPGPLLRWLLVVRARLYSIRYRDDTAQ